MEEKKSQGLYAVFVAAVSIVDGYLVLDWAVPGEVWVSQYWVLKEFFSMLVLCSQVTESKWVNTYLVKTKTKRRPEEEWLTRPPQWAPSPSCSSSSPQRPS